MTATASRHVVVLYLALSATLALALWGTLRPCHEKPLPREDQVVLPPEKNPVIQWTRPDGDERGKPVDPPQSKTFLDYYPVGKKIRSVAVVDLTGRGSNTRWGFKGSGHFAYRSFLIAETSVTENNGKKAVFEVEVLESAQMLAVREFDSLRLDPPKDSLLTDIALGADNLLLRFPQYRYVRVAAILANSADPGLEHTLTWFAGQLKIEDRFLSKDDDLAILERIGGLQGQQLRIEYIRNLGITKIQILSGRTLPDDTLASIAHNSSLLMDYYLFPAADKQEGDSWSVEAVDVAGLFNDGFAASGRGTLNIKRKKDEMFRGEKLAVLEASKEAKIELESDVEGQHQTSVLRPVTDSRIYYSVEDRLIRRAQLDWKASIVKLSTDHLLFDTKDLRDVELKTFYSAEKLNADKPATPATSDAK